MERMTLEDAIAHAKEVAEKNYRGADFESLDSIDDDIKANCIKCAEEHEQLAEWLEELNLIKIQKKEFEKTWVGRRKKKLDLIKEKIEYMKRNKLI